MCTNGNFTTIAVLHIAGMDGARWVRRYSKVKRSN